MCARLPISPFVVQAMLAAGTLVRVATGLAVGEHTFGGRNAFRSSADLSSHTVAQHQEASTHLLRRVNDYNVCTSLTVAVHIPSASL